MATAFDRVWCDWCGKECAGRVPTGGDGTFQFPRKHKGADGKTCPGVIYESRDEPPGDEWRPLVERKDTP